jgi:2-amino-4-hydroxy-6-hydroxymethyldihydropteridine diphosphokinase
MPNCLLGLGSNLGDREATLRATLADIAALPDVQIVQHSKWYRSQPVGGPPDQGEFLNAAAVIETTVAPLQLLDELGKLESRHGRQPAERWSARTIDIDILLYGNEVAETATLTLPHPRMSFRRFVLEPAAEIAPRMLHPTIGWPVERFLLHLHAARSLSLFATAALRTKSNLRHSQRPNTIGRRRGHLGSRYVHGCESPSRPTRSQRPCPTPQRPFRS